MTGIGEGISITLLRYLGIDEDKAFPGAYGWGAESVGGRGGTVVEVTNLNATGAGSFYDAINKSYPRTIVFRVGGIITLTNDLNISDPYCTIAGQTAPGGGITIKGKRLIIATHNVIIRYLSWRGDAYNFVRIQPGIGHTVHDVIIDHCSASWGWVGIGIWKEADNSIPNIYNITVQNCIIAEPDPLHPTGLLCGTEWDGYDAIDELHHVSIHHNLFVHNGHRNPRVVAKHAEVINNLVYNWHSRLGGTERASEVDWINNYFLDGPMDNDYILKHLTYEGETTHPVGSLYVNGNVAPNLGYPTPDIDNWGMYVDYIDSTPISLDHRRYSRLEAAPSGVPIQTANNAYSSVLADVGANARLNSMGNWVANIDDTDTRLLAEVIAGTGPSDPDDIVVPGAIGIIAAGTPYTDTDSDGMPDDWENARGLDPDDAADGAIVPLGLWYTNLETFLNGS